MNITKKLIASIMSLVLTFTLVATLSIGANAETTGQLMYRMYNPNSGEHFYTASSAEKDNLVTAGWQWENYGWVASTTEGSAVYRMYNANAGDHHYTMNSAEKDFLVWIGWTYEGIGWYSKDTGDVDETPLYRLYNPNALAGSHHYTLSASERDMLVNAGWQYEGECWNSNYDIAVANFKAATCCQAGNSGDVINVRTSEVLFAGEVIPATNVHIHTTYHPAVTEIKHLAHQYHCTCALCGADLGYGAETDVINHFNANHGTTVRLIDPAFWTEDEFNQYDYMYENLNYEYVGEADVEVVISPAYWTCNDCGKTSYDGVNWQ